MKVLWLCNVTLPSIASKLNLPPSPFGGWLYELSNSLQNCESVDFFVCVPINNKTDTEGTADRLTYYTFQQSGNTVQRFKKILTDINPDVIHIFGTEFKHTLDMVHACEQTGYLDRTVISIQGLVSVYAEHYFANLPFSAVSAFTLRDFLKRNNIYLQKKSFEDRGKTEIESIKKVKHIIGRTAWDKACTERINPKAKYHFCNETLRTSFYNKNWSYKTCEKHSIFVSQCSYPIKGFHHMLKAMVDIVKVYPDAKLYTTGNDPLNLSFKQRLKQTYYIKYIGRLIKKYELRQNVEFLGLLNEEQMCDRFLKSNVFVSCSSIENSPNSLGEAMLLGVPSVSSDVGGVKDMLIHEKDGFIYQADAPYMLAHYIKRIFNDNELSVAFSKNAKAHAEITHSVEINTNRLLDIYNEISGSLI